MSNRVPHLCTCRRLALACGVSLLLVGCGYKGPLYMPPPPDTLGEQDAPPSQADSNMPGEPENPSLEPAPIVIE